MKGTSEKVNLLLKEVVKENRTTLVIVTHDREIATGADRVIELADGKINRDLFGGCQIRDKIKRDLGHLACSLDVEAEIEDNERLDPG